MDDPTPRPGPFGLLHRFGQFYRSGQGLRARSARAGFWSMLEFGSSNGLRLVSNLILTRLLAPEIFGLMALASVFLGALAMLSDLGTKASVVRSKRGEDEEFLQTAWSLQVVRGLVIASIACLIAWPVSRLYEAPILFPLICVLAIGTVLQGFQSIRLATLSREMKLYKLTAIKLVVQVVTICITSFVAWQTGSVWALAAGALFGSIAHLIIPYVVLPSFPHRFRFDRDSLDELIRFGRWIMLGTFFTYLGGRGRGAIQGFLLPLDVYGVLTIAGTIGWMPGQLVAKLLGDVLFPSLSEVLRNRPQDIPRLLRRARLATIFGAFPIFFGLAFFAQPLIDLMYDPRYALAGTFLALIALNGAIGILGMPYQNLLLAEGLSHYHAALMFTSTGLRILGMVIGFHLFGVIGMVAAGGVTNIIQFGINFWLAVRRGYATGLLDGIALFLVLAVYAYILSSIDMTQVILL